MSIKRDLNTSADIQSFAVSAGSILVPFVEEVSIRVFGKSAGPDKGFVDKINNTIMAMPILQYRFLMKKGLLNYQGNENLVDDQDRFRKLDYVNEESSTDKSREIIKRAIINKALVQVQLNQNKIIDIGRETLSRGEYLIRIISDRQYPYLGELIPSGKGAKIRNLTVPGHNGVSEKAISDREVFSENEKSVSQVTDLRNKFFDKFNRLAAGEQNLDTINEGPFYADSEKDIFFGVGNMISIDTTKEKLDIFTSKSQESKLSYDGASDQYKNEARQRQYGDPHAIYKKNNLAENPQQQLTHSTFMTPVPRFSTNPLQGLMSSSEQMPQIIQAFGPIVGL